MAEVAGRAVEDHRRRARTPVALELGDLPEQAEPAVKISLFRALQELLSNATRHGGGTNVVVKVAGGEGGPGGGHTLRLRVTDDGPGFDPAQLGAAEGLGLAGVREQAELLGGSFELASRPGEGTKVDVWWPLGPRHDADEATPA